LSAEAAPPVGARAAFAAIGFALCVATLFALDRVGAPDRLVAALGPLMGFAGIAAIGIVSRARNLTDFLVARRAVPPFWAGLALAANFGGFILAFVGAAPDPTALPWRGAALGAVLAALVVAPAWRARAASSVADVLATRFASPFARVAFALVQIGSGLCLAAAGLAFAALTVREAFGLSQAAAISLSAVALVVALAPAGLRGLVWADAASAAAALVTVALFVVLSSQQGLDVSQEIAQAGQRLDEVGGAPWAQEIAAAVAAASLFAFVTPALACPSVRAARRAGFVGLAVVALGGGAALALGDLSMRSPSDSALAALVACLPAMTLARAGVFAAARAYGVDLEQARGRLSVLASARMARGRGRVVIGAVVAAWLAGRSGGHPDAPLYLALALWLAFVAPSLALSVLPGRSSGPAVAALLASLAAAAAARTAGLGSPAMGSDMLVAGFGAGLLGFGAGLALRAFDPLDASQPRTVDPFVDRPIEG
jgi:Na+/proline symporter